MPAPFVHLHCHSHYSLLQALPKIDELVDAAKQQGMTALALTDHGALYGAVEFYKACQKAGIKPIIGLEAYLALDKMADRRPRIDDRNHSLILLARDLEGYKNLINLTTAAHLDGFYYKPRIDKELLRRHAGGLIGLSGGLKGDICKAIELNDKKKAEALCREYAGIFGPDNFYLELQDHPEMDEQVARNADLVDLAAKTGLPLVATKDVHYLKPEDAEAQDLLVCISSGKTLDQDDRARLTGVDHSFVGGEHMADAFKDVPEAVANTVRIADRCDLKLDLGKWNFPDFPIPEGHDADSYLREMAFSGLEKKGELTEEAKKRLDYELEIIIKKGFSPYFLVVSDYISWAKRQGIIVTTRGSAAGSLVGYAADIVSVNPLFFKLPFERFLNPFRPSPPDIDADFADDRRDEVIAYVTEKYGKDRVAQIGTFGTMAARGSIRDVGRALGLPYGFVDKVAKLIPMGSQGFAMTISRALEETEELHELYETDPNVRRLLDLARKVEGCARHVSVHAAGVVIGNKPLTEYCPLQRESGGDKLITQYDMFSVEDSGVLKMDFLGIRNLSILGLAVKLVKETKGVDIDLKNLPFDDKKTYERLAEGETVGLFQLGGSGMTRYLKELRPTNIFDIMAMVALYRPGPMESIPEFIRRKHDPSLITHVDPRQADILGMSYGIITYQDDVLLTAINIAGYNWEEADKLRKAMGKKIPAEMAKQEDKFLQGCIKNGVSEDKARQLWDLIKPFAAYGFNKAHAASYAVVAYQTAYMKANYPAEYMTAVLTAEAGDTEKTVEVIQECIRLGLKVLPPDINGSGASYTYIDDRTIRFGLSAIKNLGDDTVRDVIAEREKNGPFADVADMAARIGTKGFNKKAIEALTMSGAMDGLGERNQLLANIDQMLEYHRQAVRDAGSGQSNLFGGLAARPPLVLRPAPPASKREKLRWERDLLGLYISEHPFREYAEFFGRVLQPIGELRERLGYPGLIRVGGFVFDVRQITTKAGEPMAFIQIGDVTGQVELVVFPRTLKECGAALAVDTAVVVEAKLQEREGELKLICERATPITADNAEALRQQLEYAARSEHRSWEMKAESRETGPTTFNLQPITSTVEEVCLKVPGKMTKTFSDELKRVLGAYPGNRRVVLIASDNGQKKRIATSFSVAFSGDFIKEVEAVLGRGAVGA